MAITAYEGIKTTDAYKLYERGASYKDKINLYSVVNQNYRYYEGNQWQGVNAGNLNTLVFNIIRSIGRYKVATILMNDTKIMYSCDGEKNEQLKQAAEQLTKYMETLHERLKLDFRSRVGLKHAYITGDLISYLYLDERGVEQYEEIDSVNFYPGNVNDPDIQRQPWIIVVCRRSVEDVRREARANGTPEQEMQLIVPDGDNERQAGDSAKLDIDESRMCNCYIKFWRDEQTGTIWQSKSTRCVEYQKPVDTLGRRYRFAHMQWEEKKGDFHGISDVEYMIPNQKALNMIMSMQLTSMRYFGFPKMVYNLTACGGQPPSNAIGTAIGLTTNADDVRKVISYLTPPQMSGDAYKVFEDVLAVTKDLNGANDAALGNINPEKASGVAIASTINQVSMPLDEQKNHFYNYLEDFALNLADMWITGNMEKEITYTGEDGEEVTGVLAPELLSELRLSVRIDVGATNRWTEDLVTQALNRMLEAKHIDFESFVKLVPRGSGIPKEQILDILRAKREEQMQMQAQQAQMQAAQGAGQQMPQGAARGSSDYVAQLMQELSPEEQEAVRQNPELMEQVLMG